MGVKRGLLVAVLGEAIFSAINPIGSGLAFPILYGFQIISIGLAGLLGGLLGPPLIKSRSKLAQWIIFGLAGFFLTLIYDVLTGLSLPLSTGMTEGTIWGSITAGIVFFATHLIANTLIFASLGPGMLSLTERQLRMHGFRDT